MNGERNTDIIRSSKEMWYSRNFTRSQKRFNIPLSYINFFFEQSNMFYKVEENVKRPMRLSMRRAYKHFGYSEIPPNFIEPLESITSFTRGIKYYSASQFTNPTLCPVSFEVEKEGSIRRPVRANRHSHTQFLIDLYRARETEKYVEFFEVIGPEWIGLIDKIAFK